MFVSGTTHRPGFLMNSWELTSMAHVPPPEISAHVQTDTNALETLPSQEELMAGVPIGHCDCAGLRQPVCIPPGVRGKHVHLIGRSGMGKSTVIESMILHDVSKGHGVAVLDPHGRLVQRILGLLPAEHVDRVIYLDPGDPRWVPRWNPFRCGSDLEISRVADDLVRAFKSFVTGWGDRLEHLLRHAIYALLHLPGSCLFDVSNLLRPKSDESQHLRGEVLKVIDNTVAKLFWRHDFKNYNSTELSPAQHKLSKLLTSGTVSLMLSQSESGFDFREVMESGKILLVDLSKVGPEVREILGCFMLSLLHLTALGRGSASTDQRLPFHIYCDEAHRFMTDALEDLIAETRKFDVSLTVAHQYMSQFATRKSDALSSVGSTIIFNVDTKDAQHLRKDLRGLVDLEDLITLEIGQAIARIGTQVVRLATHRPLDIPEENCRDLIIAQSHAKYCRPAADVQRAIDTRSRRWQTPLSQAPVQQQLLADFDTGFGSRPHRRVSSTTSRSAMRNSESTQTPGRGNPGPCSRSARRTPHRPAHRRADRQGLRRIQLSGGGRLLATAVLGDCGSICCVRTRKGSARRQEAHSISGPGRSGGSPITGLRGYIRRRLPGGDTRCR